MTVPNYAQPNYAQMLELKLKDLNVEIKTKMDQPSSLTIPFDGTTRTQLNVDGIVGEFGETHIGNLAQHIAKNFKSITCLPLVLPMIKTAEIQTSGDVVIRVIEDYVMGSGDNDPYADKVIRRVDILFY